MKRGKQIHGHSILSQQGVNLVATVVSDMGFMWTPTTGTSDAGIDGFIEIRQQDTGEATNLIVQVQSKATGHEWENETPAGFYFRCDERDLNYWLQGNAPVILVVSRPSSKEAYWVSVKDYFADLDRLKTKKVWFDKKHNGFTRACHSTLANLAKPKDSGLYLAPRPIEERLRINLLPIAHYGQDLYVAQTNYREREEVLAKLREAEVKGAYEWFLKEGRMFSFYDLHKKPWSELCEVGTVEKFDTDDWALSRDHVRRNDFVKLLNGSLRSFLGAKGIWFHLPKNSYGYFFYAPSRDPTVSDENPSASSNERSSPKELPRKIIPWKYQKESERTVFRAYYGKKDPTRIVYYRHLGFEPKFLRFGTTWFLEVTPTYHFTSDGYKVSNYAESYLAGIKRIEKHSAVHADIRFWGYVLTDRGLFTRGVEFLRISDPMTFQADFGIPEIDWLNRADEEEKERLQEGDESQIPLFE